MRGLQGRTAFITGAGGGIGAAIAERFAAEQVAVACSDIDLKGAERVASAIREAGGRAIAVEHDVAQRDSWEHALARASDELGPLDVLVNNAAVLRDRSLLKLSDEEWETVINVDLRGTFYGCQLGLAAMKGRGWGRIVNLSSVSALGSFGQANYSAAKAGVMGLTRTVAIEGARHGVLCNAIAPGSIDTPLLRKTPDDVLRQFADDIWLKRFGEPSEIASVAAFLASDEASYITGQVLYVDGGALLG